MRIGSASLLAVVFALALGSPASAEPPRAFYGVTPQTNLYPADFRMMKRGNVGTLRVPMTWTQIDSAPFDERNPFRRVYDWSSFDPAVLEAARSGVRVLPTVYGTPQWVASLQGCPANCHKLGPSSVGGLIGFSMFMRAAAQRYGPRGEYWRAHPELRRRPIRTWQIWNEQNSSDYWKPFPNVHDYGNLVEAGGDAIHAVDPGAKVILGGMIGEPAQDGKKTVSGWDFLRSLYADGDVRDAFDGIAIHPYGAKLHSVKRTVWRWRQELAAAHARRDRIWVTEIGWASGGGDHPLNKGPRGQARLIGEALEFFTKKRHKLRVANVDVYAWRDAAPGADQCLWCAESGLLHYDGLRPKPAWRVFRSFTRR